LCKSRGCPRSKASKGEAVVNYCEPLATPAPKEPAEGNGISSTFPKGKQNEELNKKSIIPLSMDYN
jgi:hypothetical protein